MCQKVPKAENVQPLPTAREQHATDDQSGKTRSRRTRENVEQKQVTGSKHAGKQITSEKRRKKMQPAHSAKGVKKCNRRPTQEQMWPAPCNRGKAVTVTKRGKSVTSAKRGKTSGSQCQTWEGMYYETVPKEGKQARLH